MEGHTLAPPPPGPIAFSAVEDKPLTPAETQEPIQEQITAAETALPDEPVAEINKEAEIR